jgi:hypothetical protein
MLRAAPTAALVIAVLLLLPAVAHAQPGARAPALPDRLHADTRTAIERLADSLRAAGVPAEPLYDKAAEGVLKGADDARIVRAVRSLAGELRAARAALGPAAADAEILAGASALHAGVPDESLRRLTRARRARGGLAVPLTVLADLVTRRVPPDVAAASVEALIDRGATDEAFAALRIEVQRDILSGLAPAAAATARTRALMQSSGRPGPAGDPRPR